MGNNKKKNNISFLKRIKYWFTGFLASLGVLSSIAASETYTIGASQEEYNRQIDIENKTNDVFEENKDLLELAKKIAAYEYNKNKNKDEKIKPEDIEITIEHGYSKANPFGVDFKRDEQGNKYALIVSSEGSEYGGYGTTLVFKFKDGDKIIIVKGAKRNEIEGSVPAYNENEKIDVENDKNNWLHKNDGEVYNIEANLVTASYKEDGVKYTKKARELLKGYLEKEGNDAVDYLMKDDDDYLMNDSNDFVNPENKNFKASMKPETTHEAGYEELAKNVLGSDVKVFIPEENENNEQINDER